MVGEMDRAKLRGEIDHVNVSVALATYNGENYLNEQLESLRVQSVLPDEVVISDDASTDNTNRLVEEFRARAPFPVLHIVNKRRLGFAENFFQAANHCSGDLILFCDQDDVWLPHKIEVIKRHAWPASQPCLIAHSALVADEELRPLSGMRINVGRRSWRGRCDGLWDVPPGFCQAVNRRLLSLRSDDRPMGPVGRNEGMAHDRWTYFVANALGEVRYIKQPLAIYRRHADTVTGYGCERAYENEEGASIVRYRFTAEYARICDEYADYWTNKAERFGPDYSMKAGRAATLYARAADFYRFRSEIYRPGNGWRDRVRALAGLWRSSDSSVRAATAYSWKQKVLDAITAFSAGSIQGSND